MMCTYSFGEISLGHLISIYPFPLLEFQIPRLTNWGVSKLMCFVAIYLYGTGEDRCFCYFYNREIYHLYQRLRNLASYREQYFDKLSLKSTLAWIWYEINRLIRYELATCRFQKRICHRSLKHSKYIHILYLGLTMVREKYAVPAILKTQIFLNGSGMLIPLLRVWIYPHKFERYHHSSMACRQWRFGIYVTRVP